MDGFTLDLQPGGYEVESNNFHTLDAYPGQVERSDVYDYGSDLNMQMNLVEIIHGTMSSSPSSLPATLIIADFQFISRDSSRRFRRATIELRFRDTDHDDSNPPEVYAIAPDGVFRMNKTEETQELKRAAKADVGATFVANVSTGLEWSLTKTATKYRTAKLTGILTKKKRQTEPKNVAMWSMDENDKDDNGIPSLLRTAILLRRQNNKRFHCGVIVSAKVDWKTRYNLESRIAGGDIDPVLFDPNKIRTTLVPPYIDAKNLGSVILTKLMAIQSNTIVETVSAIQSNTLTDGHVSGLTLENVMRSTQKVENHVVRAAGEQASSSTLEKGVRDAQKAEESVSESAEGQASGSTMENVIRTTQKVVDPVLKAADEQISGLIVENVMRTPQKVEDHVPKSAGTSGSPLHGLELRDQSGLEETMRLLLHAVRKGVEVIAEAVSIILNFSSESTFPG
jgi:hypothetical protein